MSVLGKSVLWRIIRSLYTDDYAYKFAFLIYLTIPRWEDIIHIGMENEEGGINVPRLLDYDFCHIYELMANCSHCLAFTY